MNIPRNTSNEINLGDNERSVSLLAGGTSFLLALIRPSRLSLPLALGGAFLLYRGITGKDPIYRNLEIHREREDGEEGIRIERTVTVSRPVEEVYAFWRDFSNLPHFMKHLEAVQVFEPAETGAGKSKRSHWVARGPLDAKFEWDAEIVEERENELITWRSLPGSEIENYGTVHIQPAPGNRGAEVKVILKYNPPGGSTGAAIARLLGEEPGQQVRDDLRRFKQVLEAGEVSTVQGQTSGRVEQVEQERSSIQHRKPKDAVQEASEDSFPASDPPTWATGDIDE